MYHCNQLQLTLFQYEALIKLQEKVVTTLVNLYGGMRNHLQPIYKEKVTYISALEFSYIQIHQSV